MSRARRSAFRTAVLTGAWAAVSAWLAWRVAWPKADEAVAAFGGPLNVQAAPLMAWWARNAWAALLAALVALGAAGAGGAAAAWLGRIRLAPRREAAPAAVLAGLGLYASAAVSLGLVGLLFAPVAAVLLAALAAAGWAQRARRLPAPAARLPADARALRAVAWGFGGCVALFSLTPETWWDSLFYHLNAPADFNDLHKWVDIPQAVYRYPLLAEALFSQGLLLEGEQTATLVNLVPLVLLAWLLRAWTTRLAGETAGWLAVVILLASDQIGFHLGQANQGFFSVGLAFAGTWAWSLAARDRACVRCALAAGAFLGWAMCAKYTAAVPLAGILAWEGVRMFRRPRDGGTMVAWMGAGFAAASAAFLANGWLFTGNPVYPFVFGGLGWSNENAWVMSEFGCPGSDFSLGDPSSLVRAALDYVTVQQPLALLAVPALASLPWAKLAPFAAAWAAAILVWAAAIPCLRLMMPAYPATALLAAAALAPRLARRGLSRAIAWLSIAAVGAAGTIQAVSAADFHKRSFYAAVGLEPPAAYLDRVLTSYWRMREAVERRVPPLARVLTVGEGRGYPFRALMLNRGAEDSPEIMMLVRRSATPEEIGRQFRRRGVRHLVLNFVSSEYHSRLWKQVFQWRPAELRRWGEFWRSHATVIWSDPQPDGVNGGFVLYRVERRAHPPSPLLPFLPGAEVAALRQPGEDDEAWLARLLDLERLVPGVVYFDARRTALLLERGRATEALRWASRGLATAYPEREALLGLRGMALMKLGRAREAAVAFRAAERLRPDVQEFTRRRREAERAAERPGRLP